MRTVLIGSDFMYDKDGNLRPIEINTAVGQHSYKLESDEDVYDLTGLSTFISDNSFTKVHYIGGLYALSSEIEQLCTSLNIEYELHESGIGGVTIPFIEDNDATLIIRSAYDTTALVDDTYCRDKVNFLELIKNESFGAQFAYMDETGNLVNNIATINDNNGHPNFILKSRLPDYNKSVYPKLFKVSTQSELDVVISQNVDNDYFLMEFYYNEASLYQNHIIAFRGLNLLFPPELNSISLGGYTTLTTRNLNDVSTFDETTFELVSGREKYIAGVDSNIKLPKLLDTDYVVMGDDTLKTGLDLQVGDVVKTIDIPNPFNVNSASECVNYNITYDEFVSGSTYSTNVVTHKTKVSILSHTTKITFTDGSDWLDTENSFYLCIKNNEVRFLKLSNKGNGNINVMVGDSIVLVNTTNTTTPEFVVKEIANVELLSEFFDGWLIGVEREHLFLTRASAEDDTSYVAIEHNWGPSCSGYYWRGWCYSDYPGGECDKTYPYCCTAVFACTPNCQTQCVSA